MHIGSSPTRNAIMSLSLDLGTVPEGLSAKTFGPGMGNMSGKLFLGAHEITDRDFACLVDYWLTNADLDGLDDPRIDLVRRIKESKYVPGYNSNQLKIHMPFSR